MQNLVDIASKAALVGAAVAQDFLDGLETLEFKVKDSTKTPGSDVVSQADRATEAAVRGVISSLRPSDAILGEECGLTSGSGLTWIIDPINGTLNFSYARNEWAVSVAVRDSDRTLAAAVAVSSPSMLFTASVGGGSFLNGSPIKVSGSVSLSDALIDVGRGRGASRAGFVSVLSALDASCKDVRRSGCAALAACQVACGSLDAMYGPGLEVWDIAAGALIASEAGAVVRERSDGVFLISSPGVAEEFYKVIAAGLPCD